MGGVLGKLRGVLGLRAADDDGGDLDFDAAERLADGTGLSGADVEPDDSSDGSWSSAVESGGGAQDCHDAAAGLGLQQQVEHVALTIDELQLDNAGCSTVDAGATHSAHSSDGSGGINTNIEEVLDAAAGSGLQQQEEVEHSPSTIDNIQVEPIQANGLSGNWIGGYVEDKTIDTFKMPILRKAIALCDKAMRKVHHLSVAALRMKKLSPNKFTGSKKTKQDSLNATAADRIALADICKAIECKDSKKLGSITTKLPRYYVKAHLKMSSKTSTTSRLASNSKFSKPGVDLINWKGSFAVPTFSVSGNVHVDEMNIILFNLMMSVTELLESGLIAKFLAKVYCKSRRMMDIEADRCAAICKLRSTCKNIRSTILSLGFLPLREPLDCWRDTYGNLKF